LEFGTPMNHVNASTVIHTQLQAHAVIWMNLESCFVQ
jgi:hypothetical protein